MIPFYKMKLKEGGEMICLLKKFYPDERVDSVYDFDFHTLLKKRYRLLIFDIDNTLVRHGAPADKKAVTFFDKLKKLGFATCLISNNSRARVEPFALAVGADFYIFKAGKPKAEPYLKAIRQAGVEVGETAFFGDQLFTDVYGAKRLGIRNYAVKPIHKKEEIQIVLKRRLEKIVYYFYEKDRRKRY